MSLSYNSRITIPRDYRNDVALILNQDIQDVPPLYRLSDALSYLSPRIDEELYERISNFLLKEEGLYNFEDFYNFKLRENHPLHDFFLTTYYNEHTEILRVDLIEKRLYNRELFLQLLSDFLEEESVLQDKFYVLTFNTNISRGKLFVIVAPTPESALAKLFFSSTKISYMDSTKLYDPLNVFVYDTFFVWEDEELSLDHDIRSILRMFLERVKIEETKPIF